MLLVVGIAAMVRIILLPIQKGKYYRGEIGDVNEIVIDDRIFRIEKDAISGKRGNLFSDDGTVLLSNVFIYDLYWYPSYITKKDHNLFMSRVDSLIRIFHRINPNKSISTYNVIIKQSYLDYRRAYEKASSLTKSNNTNIRKQGYKIIDGLQKQYVLIRVSNVNQVGKWVRQKDIDGIDALFAEWQGDDQLRGGCKKDRREVRRQLTGSYPKSVLGIFESVSSQHKTDSIIFRQGIEGYYDSILRGELRDRRVLKVNNGTVRLKENRYLSPQNGYDITTTINNDIQRVTKNALEKQLLNSGARWGCAIVMEVESGEIKAICNLDRVGNRYEEQIDHATSERYEPGSTFKLMTLLAALESGKVDTNTIVSCSKGNFTLKRAFVISDNKGLYDAAIKGYPSISAFLSFLKKMSLDENLHIETAQAQTPHLKPITNKESDYKNITHGYSIKIPPIYMLAYYNAIANNGIYIRPTFVKSVRPSGKTVNESVLNYKKIINPAICSPITIAKIKDCLEAVITEGTAKRARDEQYLSNIKKDDTTRVYHPLIAGKTGTAFLYDKKYSDTLKNSSFIGYFPSQKPKYTCLVLISGTVLDASYTAVPVFKEIADKLYTYDMEIELSKSGEHNQKNIPVSRFGYSKDVNLIYEELKIPVKYTGIAPFVSAIKNKDKEVVFNSIDIQGKILPKLNDATAKDAVYILEKMGYAVQMQGRGKVRDIQINEKKATLYMEN
jgi:cell division protein FtsI (penicillin-binding protein 3)